MKKLLFTLIFVFLHSFAVADVDEFDDISTVDEYDGISTVDETDGQTIASDSPIGSVGAQPGSTDGTYNYCAVTENSNAADATGEIRTIKIKIDSGSGTIQVACVSESGGDFTTTGYAQMTVSSTGVLTLNAPGDFTAFDCNIGDYIAFTADAVSIARNSSGGSIYYDGSREWHPWSSHTLTYYDYFHLYLYGDIYAK